MRSGSTIDAGTRDRLPRSRSSMISEQTSRETPCSAKQRIDTVTSMPSGLLGSGRSRIVRDGCRSSSPASVRLAAVAHFGGAQATCVITLVRALNAPVGPLALPELRELPLDLLDDSHQCRRQLRPSRRRSSSAPSGPHVPAA